MKSRILIAGLLTCSTVISTLALAQGNDNSETNKGSTPNGKPFLHLNAEVQANAEAISSLEVAVQGVIDSVSDITLELDDLEALVQLNQVAISQLQVDLAATDQEIATLQQQVIANIADINADIALLNSQVGNLQTALGDLTANLAVELVALQQATADNSDGISGLLVTVSSLTSQILLIDQQIDNHEGRISALEDTVVDLLASVDALDLRLVAIEMDVDDPEIEGLCFSFENTLAEDLTGNTWFDNCVTAAQDGGSIVRLVLKDVNGDVVYDASGGIVGNWTQANITSTTTNYGAQYHHSTHDRMIFLDNGDKLMISGNRSSNGGCGGSFGNGYGIVVYPSNPDYYRNPKMIVMPYMQTVSFITARYFSGWSPMTEISYGGSSFNSCSGVPGFEGTFEFYVY